MKKIFLFIASVCIFASSLSAQLPIEKGKLLTGISTAMALRGYDGPNLFGLRFVTESHKHDSNSAEAEYKHFIYNFLPQAGYFFTDNIAAGLSIELSGNSIKEVDDDDKWNETSFAIGPFVRYYYPLEKMYPYAEIMSLVGTYKMSWEDESEGIFSFGLGVGSAIPLGDIVSLDILAKYLRTSYSWKYSGDGSGKNKEIFSGIGISVGFFVYLDKFF